MNKAVKRLVFLTSLLCAVVFASSGLAQEPAPNQESDVPAEVAVARCAYASVEGVCAVAPPSDAAAAPGTRDTVSQFRGRMPGPPIRAARPPRIYPGGGYPGVWASNGGGRQTLIGALIGFGLGAAAGAKANTDPHPGAGATSAVLGGCFGALLGGFVGHSIAAFPTARHRHLPVGRPDEADELASSRSNPRK